MLNNKKRNYKLKKTISARQLIQEFGGDFSKHMKERILDLGKRCVFTRDEETFRLDLKHVEHKKYEDPTTADDTKKEYVYGQLVMNEGSIFFSESCLINEELIEVPKVKEIFNSMTAKDIYMGEDGIKAKKIDDSNIDFVIDGILEVCPEVSQAHLDILEKYAK